MVLISISAKASSTGIHTVVITATDISGSKDTYTPTFITCLVGPHLNLTGGRITTGTGLYASIFSFVNITTGWWYAFSFAIDECAAKDTSVDAFSVSLYLHNYVVFLCRDSMLHPHIILTGQCYTTDWYYNNLVRRLCTTWGKLASDSNIFCSPLKSEISVNFDPHKYFVKISVDHLTVAASTTDICLDFSSGDTVDLEMKENGCRRIPSREFSNSHFPQSFSYASNFIDSSETSTCRTTDTIKYFDQSVLMYNLLEGSGIAKIGPDKISFFNRSSNLCSSGFHRFCISYISSLWDIVPSWGCLNKVYL